jgi:phosphonate utilization transcriptional regulator
MHRMNAVLQGGRAAHAVNPTIALLQSSSLSSVVQQEIERMIVAGEIHPGDKLTEAMLAERLGVSRGPVREAFRMLEEAGLVRQEKNRGVFVRDVPLDEAMEIYELRAMMDAQVGRQLASTILPEQMREMRAMVAAMERAVKSDDADGYHLLNLKFHDRLVELTGNRKLAAIYRRLIRELSLFRRMNLADEAVLPVSATEHRRILKAIGSGDPDAAAHAMREHVMASRERTARNNRSPQPDSAAKAPRNRRTPP